jgi:hypothetical protein
MSLPDDAIKTSSPSPLVEPELSFVSASWASSVVAMTVLLAVVSQAGPIACAQEMSDS